MNYSETQERHDLLGEQGRPETGEYWDDRPCDEFVDSNDVALNGQPACGRCGYTEARHG